MARPLRYPFPATELQPGRIFHVTNRGVDRGDLFHTELDRVVFLSLVADACAQTGAVVHAFCLMTNHFHMVVEDTRGLLSIFMHRIESVYARFFNDTRAGRRIGPLFQGRFHADEIADRAYFDDACSYVFNNPLRTVPAMASQPENYRWSSAAFALSSRETTATAFCATLLNRVGGIDGVLASFAPTARKRSAELRIRRLEALASGLWLERHHVLDGRSPAEYRKNLGDRLCATSAFARGVDDHPVRENATGSEMPRTSMGRRVWRLPTRPEPFAGVLLDTARGQIEEACARLIPAIPKAALAYLLSRFCAATRAEIARALRTTPAAVASMIERVRAARSANQGFASALWRAEWALHWRLLAAPFRL